jgi:hypothetical protein
MHHKIIKMQKETYFNFPSSASSTSSVASAASESSNPSQEGDDIRRQTTRNLAPSIGLSVPLQRQLARDLEKSGGLHIASLKEVCNRKPDIYGNRQSPQRKAIQNKVFQWKRLSEEAFQSLLIGLKVKPRESSVPAPLPTPREKVKSSPPRPPVSSPQQACNVIFPPPSSLRTTMTERLPKDIARAFADENYGM